MLGTDDRWDVSFALRALPFVRAAPVGPWPHTKPPPYRLLARAAAGCRRRPRRGSSGVTSPAYGPATREDIQQFTGFRLGQIDAALAGHSPSATGSTTCRARRAPPRTRPLPFASCLRSTRSSSRTATGAGSCRPSTSTSVFNKKNATTKNTFTVDGFVAGAWRIEKKRIAVEPFAPLPARVRREVDAEAERLLAWYLA